MAHSKDDAHLVEHTLDHVEVLKGHFLHAFRVRDSPRRGDDHCDFA